MRRSTKGRVYDALKRELLQGMIRPGERINDSDLGTRFACSRGPVREALLALEGEGLVRIVPRHGYFASEINVSDALDAYQLRLILEPIATAMAAQRIRDSDLADLRAMAELGDDGSDEGFARAVATNRRFHMRVAEVSGNARLARIMGELLDELNRLAHVELRTARTAASWCEEHREIIAALEQRDPALAARVVRATFMRDEGLLPLRARADLVRVLEEAHAGDAGAVRTA